MPALTPSFLFDFESNMQTITETEYNRLSNNLWWPGICRERPSKSKRERIGWLLSTAMIREGGKGGQVTFDDLVALSTEYTNRNAQAGLKLDRDQVEDNDGNGFDLASQWSSDIGAYMAYWPQKQVIKAILNGENAKAYDGQNYFAGHTAGTTHTGNHPYNPFNVGVGGYANLFTGAADGAYYPGAKPIDDSVTVDVAIANLSALFGYIASIKMPNGEDPRKLRARQILCPSRMVPRVQQLTNAKFIAQAAATGGGGADVEALIRNWGMAQPIEVEEFGGAFTYPLDQLDGGSSVTGDDKTFYIACDQISNSQLGALTYVNRLPFQITYYTGNGGGSPTGLDAVLDRARELEWHCQGRNVTGYGHPFLLFKCKAT